MQEQIEPSPSRAAPKSKKTPNGTETAPPLELEDSVICALPPAQKLEIKRAVITRAKDANGAGDAGELKEPVFCALPPAPKLEIKHAVTAKAKDANGAGDAGELKDSIICTLPPAPKLEIERAVITKAKDANGTGDAGELKEPVFCGLGPASKVEHKRPIIREALDTATAKEVGQLNESVICSLPPAPKLELERTKNYEAKENVNGAGVLMNSPSTTGTHSHVKILTETTTRIITVVKEQLGEDATGLLRQTPTFESLRRTITSERLRTIPHQGSRWDLVLGWAESFAKKVDAFSRATGDLAALSTGSVAVIYGSCVYLLEVSQKPVRQDNDWSGSQDSSDADLIQMREKYIVMLEKVFRVFYRIGLALEYFLQHKQHFHASPTIQMIIAQAYSCVVELAASVTIHYKTTSISES